MISEEVSSTRTKRLRWELPISSGAWKHLVDTKNVERMYTNTQVESILSSVLCHVLVARNTRRLQSLGRYILLLPTNEMYTERKFLNSLSLHTHIVDTDLGVWNSPTKPWLGVGFVLNLPVASCRPWTNTLNHELNAGVEFIQLSSRSVSVNTEMEHYSINTKK